MADPFGLKAGSTPPAGAADYFVVFHSVPKPHPSFQSYRGFWNPDRGLTRIMAQSTTFEDDPYCASSRELYDRVKRQLTQLYGAPENLEYLDDDGRLADADEFYSSLQHNERSHCSRWATGDGHALEDQVAEITLTVAADDTYNASFVSLTYKFEGHDRGGPSDEYGLESL